jgi:CheY-like chemotaxis protein
MRILVAIADPLTREFIVSTIPIGYVLEEACDGDETIEHIMLASERLNPFDLLVLDLELAKLDGLHVLSLLRGLEEPRRLANRTRTKVLIVSGRTEGEVIYQAHALECDGYLVKPLERKRFLAEVNRLCPKL